MQEQAADHRPDAKGDWYFRMLGMKPEGELSTLREVAADRHATRTSELVTEMWEETAELPTADRGVDLLKDWVPSELSSTVASRRKVRWAVVILALLIGSVAGFALWWMPQASEQRVAAHSDLMRNSLANLYADLGRLQQSLAAATEPTSAEPDLSSVTIGLAATADSAARLLDVANRDIPAPLPLTTPEPFDDLEVIRAGLGPLAAEATSIRTAIAEIAAYRSALLEVMDVGELPLTADSATVTSQGSTLAQTLASSVAALSSMPTSGPFSEHRSLVDAAVTRFAQWQEDYLDTLRSGDAGVAERLVAELSLDRQALQDQLVATLAELRAEVDGRILQLADDLSRTLARVPQ